MMPLVQTILSSKAFAQWFPNFPAHWNPWGVPQTTDSCFPPPKLLLIDPGYALDLEVLKLSPQDSHRQTSSGSTVLRLAEEARRKHARK